MYRLSSGTSATLSSITTPPVTTCSRSSQASAPPDDWEALWEMVRPSAGFLRWFARRPSGEVLGGHVERPSGLQRIAANMDRLGYNTYIGLNHTNQWRGIRIKGTDIDRIGAIVLDLDPVDGECAPVAAALAAIDLAEGLLGRRIYPAVIDTGRGVQAWVLLDTEPHSAPLVARAFEHGVRRLLVTVRDQLGDSFGCRLDTTVSDAARVARCPFTTNTKTGRTARVLQWGEPVGFADWEHHPIWRAAGDEREHRSLLRRDKESGHPVTLDKIWGRLTVTARRFLSHGVHEPGRHAAAFATAASLAESNIDESYAHHVVLSGARRSTPSLSDADARRCVANAYLRVQT